MEIGIGWIQWEPGQKHHYMIRKPNGWYWTACEMWGTSYKKVPKMVAHPAEKKKCKLCLRKLEEPKT